MPGLSPRNLSTSAGLRDSSSLTLSGVRSGAATAAEMAGAGPAVLARSGAEATIASDSARDLIRRIRIPPWVKFPAFYFARARRASGHPAGVDRHSCLGQSGWLGSSLRGI